MSIKIIAVDMDGTFLNDQMSFDRQRFSVQYSQLKENGIRFVVASGNQYYQLISFFPDIAHEIAFVAENGAYVSNKNTEVFCGEISSQATNKVLKTLLSIPYLDVILCGKNGAYMLSSSDEDFYATMSKYYYRLKIIDNFNQVTEPAFKFAISLPNEKLPGFMTFIEQKLAGIVTPVSSGHGSVDLIIPGVHKANGIKLLQKNWGVKDEEVVTFGDGGNDVEMLQYAGFGYAMANAPDNIKKIAKYQAESNNDSGVLNIIDKIIKRESPFA
ncbi:Cof-type HAD-IIB family hydrolase [Yersinia mollaretii]|uniref:Cof-type HAD-IIB family hydrolase n=1 Tax=Yersinia mollaretii TaxID=33060 RepID=UPI0005E3BF1B|nr:Cof-type HAD-IIB family hydrolase [Yersinia mollaretii]MDA5525729.1 Cof-type HAD-IIB family hydrolase [Yersinia mollaretii]MDR7871832.1 Cof-type HAD-IIB family hydrolase [Yersinia mollaretii]PHZ32035.1 HAD family hydrolase [Yersinia mollaretii]WQC73622.1 Cof-type HAD-IIB family hydrolase [Yersinia mollaretii]CNE10184.1 putative hydrolase [Yersinia mollaretii]